MGLAVFRFKNKKDKMQLKCTLPGCCETPLPLLLTLAFNGVSVMFRIFDLNRDGQIASQEIFIIIRALLNNAARLLLSPAARARAGDQVTQLFAVLC